MQIKNAVALVSGGLSGLGRATAQTLAEAGAKVVVLDLPREDGDEIAAQIGAEVSYCAADVTSAEQV
ncbi:SDR family NAD(P)-dependent oxidoreductase, partial [Glutamicibacter creatinolyticus]